MDALILAAGHGTDLVDLNGDGLPDILKTDLAPGEHNAFINTGVTNMEGARVIYWLGPTNVNPGAGTAWSFNLSSADTHLADMDGDGLADLVHNTGLGEAFFFANKGRLAWGSRQDLAVDPPFPPSPFGETDVRTADFDFDKRIDIIRANGSASINRCRPSNSNGFTAHSRTLNICN